MSMRTRFGRLGSVHLITGFCMLALPLSADKPGGWLAIPAYSLLSYYLQ
jgi:hypothetical protein